MIIVTLRINTYFGCSNYGISSKLFYLLKKFGISLKSFYLLKKFSKALYFVKNYFIRSFWFTTLKI